MAVTAISRQFGFWVLMLGQSTLSPDGEMQTVHVEEKRRTNPCRKFNNRDDNRFDPYYDASNRAGMSLECAAGPACRPVNRR